MISPTINNLFEPLPPKLRSQLLAEFAKIHDSYIYGQYQSTELNAARFCEIVYTIIEGYQNNHYAPEASKPKSIADACKKLENAPDNIPRSMRILIPRLLPVLYEIRNNRNIGHISGDINPNYMDATLSSRAVNWIMAELIRVFHGLEMDDAQIIVDKLSSSGSLPIIFSINGKERILNPNLDNFDQTLIILYKNSKRPAKELFNDIEYSSLSMFKKRILEKGHKKRLWEYDKATQQVTILPPGISTAEQIIRESTI